MEQANQPFELFSFVFTVTWAKRRKTYILHVVLNTKTIKVLSIHYSTMTKKMKPIQVVF